MPVGFPLRSCVKEFSLLDSVSASDLHQWTFLSCFFEALSAPRDVARANFRIGVTLLPTGDNTGALEHSQRGLATFDRKGFPISSLEKAAGYEQRVIYEFALDPIAFPAHDSVGVLRHMRDPLIFATPNRSGARLIRFSTDCLIAEPARCRLIRLGGAEG